MAAESVRGRIINVHALGATVRLDDGRLGAVAIDELDAHRPRYIRAHERHELLPFVLEGGDGRHPRLRLQTEELPIEPSSPTVPLSDEAFEARMADYLRETQEWAPPDRPQPFERHFLRKKRRAAHFGPPS